MNSDTQVLSELGVNDYHYQMGYRESRLDFFRTVRFIKIAWSEIKTKLLNPIFTPSGAYHENSEALKITVAVFDAFYKEVLKHGALPVIIIFPDEGDQHRNRDGKPRR